MTPMSTNGPQPMPEHQETIELQIDAFTKYEDIAPFADELNGHVLNVNAHRTNHVPPQVDGSEIILWILLTPAGIFAKRFLEEFASDAYAVCKRKLLDMYRKAQQRKLESENSSAFEIGVGDLRFYFYGDVSEEEFPTLLRKASECLDVIPQEMLTMGATPIEYHLRWDHESREYGRKVLSIHGALGDE